MKRIVFLIILIVLSCNKNELKNYTVLEGYIENPDSDSLSIFNKDRMVFKTIKLSEHGTFQDTLRITEGYYFLGHGNRFNQMFLKPEYDLELLFDGKASEKPIVFVGKGAIENNYLIQKAQFQNRLKEKTNPSYYLKLVEEKLLKLTDSLTQLHSGFLAKFTYLDNTFISLEKNATLLEIGTILNVYKNMSRQKPDFELSKNYPIPYGNIDLNNAELIKLPGFIWAAESFYEDINYEKHLEDKSLDFYTLMLETIEKQVKDENIRQELAYNTAYNRMLYTRSLEDFYKKYMDISTNESYKTKVTEKYDQLKIIAKGAVSPPFEFYDINNKLVSLKDLRGKPVFIDLWATWCRPCIAEIPALKKLETKFKQIHFVSICKSDTEEKWRKMVVDKELQGIQLYAPDDNISFFKDYVVEGIPRFILLDSNGKIIDSNAKRPSNPNLENQLTSLP